MQIKFKNLGKVREESLELKPLTILTGNYEERDFLIRILYSIFSKIKEISERDINFIVENSIRVLWNLKNYKNIMEKLFNLEDKELKKLLKEIEKNTINYIKGDLSNIKGILNYQGITSFDNFHIESIVLRDFNEDELADIKEKLRNSIREYEAKKIALINLHSNPFKELFVYGVLRKFFYPFYIPASRNGLILGADYIIPNLFSKFRKIDVEFTKPEIDFIKNLFFLKTANLTEVEKNNKKVLKLIKFLESRILKGQFTEKDFINRYRTFNFIAQQNKEIYPLHLLKSSLISIFPIYVFLKYLMFEDKLIFFIQEPEAHLSVEEQFELAKFLTLGTNLGINFVISTNSDYILFEISNFVKINQLKPLIKTNYLIENNLDEFKECVIQKEKVLVYNFKEYKNSLKIEKVPIDEFGINGKSLEKR
ncbi:MAG: hypothetical protein DSY59_01890 [Persephonella sp.]|nr:MAG: hypothetical protein DSY59_01890 [Persephonella sp.]